MSETTADTYIEVEFNSQIITLLIKDEPKYSPLDVFFQNKEGAQQVITFFKERSDNFTITDNSYESIQRPTKFRKSSICKV